MVAGIVLLALGMKKALEAIPALASLGVLAAVLCALIAYEKTQFGELRDRLRNQVETPAHEQSP